MTLERAYYHCAACGSGSCRVTVSEFTFLALGLASGVALVEITDRLPGKARPGTKGEDRRIVHGADAHRRDHIIGVARADDTERHVAIIGGVGRIHRPGRPIGPDVAVQSCPKLGLQRAAARS